MMDGFRDIIGKSNVKAKIKAKDMPKDIKKRQKKINELKKQIKKLKHFDYREKYAKYNLSPKIYEMVEKKTHEKL